MISGLSLLFVLPIAAGRGGERGRERGRERGEGEGGEREEGRGGGSE